MDFIMNYKATNITGGHHPVEVLILEPLFWVIFHGPLEAVCLLPISGQRLSWSHDMLHVLSPSIEPMCRNDIWQSSWAAGAERVWDWLLHFLLLLEIWLQLARERVLVVISDSPISSAKSSFDLWISLVFVSVVSWRQPMLSNPRELGRISQVYHLEMRMPVALPIWRRALGRSIFRPQRCQ